MADRRGIKLKEKFTVKSTNNYEVYYYRHDDGSSSGYYLQNKKTGVIELELELLPVIVQNMLSLEDALKNLNEPMTLVDVETNLKPNSTLN